jgi:2,4-dienoyl-CoA reductase-like NADH-dependent reductase (Old Yellow Enzyme family)
MTIDIESKLTLPCGIILKNRLAKAALTEGIADAHNRANSRLTNLYARWAAGGCGLLLTGNVQVDRRYLERPGNMAVDGNGGLDALRAVAEAGSADNTQIWMQINHPGRQTPIYLNPRPVGPSATALDFGGGDFNGIGFGDPRALTGDEVEDIVRRFAHVSAAARETGFTGVQIHAAHGYLLSQFLTPRVNKRTDKWGGPLENRARLLLEIVRAARRAVGPNLAVSVKLNSSDFQKGGFSHEECLQVVQWLDEEGVDLLELSGGNYEQLSMGGAENETDVLPVKESTRQREAYFLAYAESIRQTVRNTPLMVTGGFRSRAAMDEALAEGAASVIGLGRPLCSAPDAANHLLDRSAASCAEPDLSVATTLGYYYMQLTRLADNAKLYTHADCEQAQIDLGEHELAKASALQGRELVS